MYLCLKQGVCVWMGVCRPLLSVNRSLVYVGAGPHLLAVETDTGKKVGTTCMHTGDVDRSEKAHDGFVCMPRLRSCVRKPGAADSHDSTTCRPFCISPTDPLCMCIGMYGPCVCVCQRWQVEIEGADALLHLTNR